MEEMYNLLCVFCDPNARVETASLRALCFTVKGASSAYKLFFVSEIHYYLLREYLLAHLVSVSSRINKILGKHRVEYKTFFCVHTSPLFILSILFSILVKPDRKMYNQTVLSSKL